MAKTVHHQDLQSYFGDEDHLQISQNTSFASLIFETLSERKPSPCEMTVFELILNLSIDHGSETPSAEEVIQWTGRGETISDSVAAGIKKIDNRHGGAIEPAMELFYEIKKQNIAPSEVVKRHLAEGNVIPGFGHRIYKDSDPRAQLILKTLTENNLNDEYIEIAGSIAAELEQQKGKKLPLNIDGAIAVALCGLDWNSNLGKAVFIIARVPGLCAHFLNNS